MAKVILSSRIKHLVGILESDYPFMLQRDSKGNTYTRRTQPYRGGADSSHWDFLKLLVDMCGNGLYIIQIEVSVNEIAEALSEKCNCHFLPLQVLKWTGKKDLNAEEFSTFASWLEKHGIGVYLREG